MSDRLVKLGHSVRPFLLTESLWVIRLHFSSFPFCLWIRNSFCLISSLLFCLFFFCLIFCLRLSSFSSFMNKSLGGHRPSQFFHFLLYGASHISFFFFPLDLCEHYRHMSSVWGPAMGPMNAVVDGPSLVQYYWAFKLPASCNLRAAIWVCPLCATFAGPAADPYRSVSCGSLQT